MKTTLAAREPIHGPAVPVRASAALAEVAEGESVHRVAFAFPEKKGEAVAVVVRCATPDGSPCNYGHAEVARGAAIWMQGLVRQLDAPRWEEVGAFAERVGKAIGDGDLIEKAALAPLLARAMTEGISLGQRQGPAADSAIAPAQAPLPSSIVLKLEPGSIAITLPELHVDAPISVDAPITVPAPVVRIMPAPAPALDVIRDDKGLMLGVRPLVE